LCDAISIHVEAILWERKVALSEIQTLNDDPRGIMLLFRVAGVEGRKDQKPEMRKPLGMFQPLNAGVIL